MLYYRAFEELKPLAVEVDLEKYLDIYEISRSEVVEWEISRDVDQISFGEDNLRAYKTGLQKLHLSRKLFLCGLLAISADGGKLDLARWSVATRIMSNLSAEIVKASQGMNDVLEEEEGKSKKLQSLRSGLSNLLLQIIPFRLLLKCL